MVLLLSLCAASGEAQDALSMVQMPKMSSRTEDLEVSGFGFLMINAHP